LGQFSLWTYVVYKHPDVKKWNDHKASGNKQLISIIKPVQAPNHGVLSTGATESDVFISCIENPVKHNKLNQEESHTYGKLKIHSNFETEYSTQVHLNIHITLFTVVTLSKALFRVERVIR
jgi:hypothetical protein